MLMVNGLLGEPSIMEQAPSRIPYTAAETQ